MSEEDEIRGADFVEHGLSCRLELADGTIISSDSTNLFGDLNKMGSNLRVTKPNLFMPEVIEISESPHNNTPTVSQTLEDVSVEVGNLDAGVAYDVAHRDTDVSMPNGGAHSPGLTTGRRSNLDPRERKQTRSGGHSNVAYDPEEDATRQVQYF